MEIKTQTNVEFNNFTSDDILIPYKKIIQASVCPEFGNTLALLSGANAIQAYKKTTNCKEGTLELMMYFVECGNKFTILYGDIDEDFYGNLETMFQDVVDIVKQSNKEIIDHYLPRLKRVVKDADGIGWGYYDTIEEYLSDAFPNSK